MMTPDTLTKLIRASRRLDNHPKRIERDEYAHLVYYYESHSGYLQNIRRANSRYEWTTTDIRMLTNTMAEMWDLHVTILFSDSTHNKGRDARAWALGTNRGVIELSVNARTPQYVIHELSHCIIDSWCFLRPNQKLFEAHHGPIFQTMLAINYCLTYNEDLNLEQMIENMEQWGLAPLSLKSANNIIGEYKNVGNRIHT